MTDPGPRSARLSARLAVSPSQLKDLLRCERAWFLKSVARVQDDSSAGGQYLLQGDLFDQAVQLWSARWPDLDPETLVSAVRAKSGLRGAALDFDDAKWFELATRALVMLRADVGAGLLPPPKTAAVQHRYRVVVPGFEAEGGVVLTGATDLRQPGRVWDTKTTNDRGPGRGAAADRRPTALTRESLARDVQALCYAWCEFQANPDLLWCEVRWVYVSKSSPTNPVVWGVEANLRRDVVEAWFAETVRPLLARQLALATESATLGLDEPATAALAAAANHDGCARCFVRSSCNPFLGLQAHATTTQNAGDQKNMPTIAERRAEQAARLAAAAGGAPARPAAPDLEAQLRASLVAAAAEATGGTQDDRRADVAVLVHVPVNRPDAPPRLPPAPPVLDVVGEEVPADGPKGPELPSLAASTSGPVGSADTVSGLGAPGASAAAEPRRGRGRPRKAPAEAFAASPVGAPAPVSSPVSEEDIEALATAAQTIADAADALVSRLNQLLRARGVRV